MTIQQGDYGSRPYPIRWNGYAFGAPPAEWMTADQVKPGDVLLLDGYVSTVQAVRPIPLGSPNWHALHITGDINIIRFAHERLSVLRTYATPPQPAAASRTGAAEGGSTGEPQEQPS